MGLDMMDLGSVVIVSPPDISDPEGKAITMLVEEVERRTRIRWTRSST